MLKPLILRADTGSVSGYKQLIEKTIKILSKHYDLIILPVFYEKNDCQGYKKINKKNWNCPELYLSPMSNDEHLSFLGGGGTISRSVTSPFILKYIFLIRS